MSVTHYNGKKLYKVLVNGKSCHGGDFTWSLPVQNADGTWTPGDWTPEVEANLCSSGYHATWEPVKWANKADIEVYEVEFDDAVQGSEDYAKVVGKRCRLLSKVIDAAVLLALHIVVSGSFELRDGYWYVSSNASVKAWDNANVKAWDNANVKAWGNASVKAWDNANVEASGNASVEAWDNANVEAFGNASVKAFDNANVEAWDNANVEAFGNANVEASGNASVEAFDNANVEAWDNAVTSAHSNSKIKCSSSSTVISCSCHSESATVTLHDNAVHVDRRSSRPVCRIAGNK